MDPELRANPETREATRRCTVGVQYEARISSTEDKLVQDSLRELLEAIYEPIFMECSYGFRPGRRAHDALRALDQAVHSSKVNWILEADIVSFFDRIDRKMLKELLGKRIADKGLMRLIGKCLHVGVLDGGNETLPELGTVQGSTLSPVLANIYLHYALDLWFEQDVKPRMRGQAILIRYCDDFIMGFEHEEDAKRVMEALRQRMAKYGMELHPEKTRMLDFRRPSLFHKGNKGPETFEFLGFLMLWKRRRATGGWYMAMKTRRARLLRAKKAVYDFCRDHRHWSVKDQHAALWKRIQGHFNYFGLRGNERSLSLLVEAARRAWHKWLNRRSQRSHLSWRRFAEMLGDYPLPKPIAKLSLWANS